MGPWGSGFALLHCTNAGSEFCFCFVVVQSTNNASNTLHQISPVLLPHQFCSVLLSLHLISRSSSILFLFLFLCLTHSFPLAFFPLSVPQSLSFTFCPFLLHQSITFLLFSLPLSRLFSFGVQQGPSFLHALAAATLPFSHNLIITLFLLASSFFPGFTHKTVVFSPPKFSLQFNFYFVFFGSQLIDSKLSKRTPH